MNPAAPSPSAEAVAQAFREVSGSPLTLMPSEQYNRVMKRAREIDATTSVPAATVGGDAMLTQALTDPENQPSQWGTIPLSMLPARMDDSREPFPIDSQDYDHGYASGWNACLDRIASPAASVGGDDWVLVPREPTPAMLEQFKRPPFAGLTLSDRYARMLACAPTPNGEQP